MNTMVTTHWAAREVARAFLDRCADQGHTTHLAEDDTAPEGAEQEAVGAMFPFLPDANLDAWRSKLESQGRSLADKVIGRNWDVLACQQPTEGSAYCAQAMSKDRGVAVRVTFWPRRDETFVRSDVLGGYAVPPVHAWETWR